MELATYFHDFLQAIRPTKNQIDDFKAGHRKLRDRLPEDEDLSSAIVSTFLQGSYRRATAIRPNAEAKADVDIIVVTKLSSEEFTPDEALKKFIPFMDKYYKDKYELQSRSIGISLSYVDLDVVITAAPSESEVGILESDAVTTYDTPEAVDDWRLVKSWVSMEDRSLAEAAVRMSEARKEAEWKTSPLLIPDRDRKSWEETHPLAQIQWAWNKNRACNGHYVNVVKALKWWRRAQGFDKKRPKGYPFERLIGECCPDQVDSIARGVTETLEAIASRFEGDAMSNTTPFLPDHGVTDHNVLQRISGKEFAQFHSDVKNASRIAREALDANSVRKSALAWRTLFGDKFPEPPPGEDDSGGHKKGGYTERTAVTTLGGGRFAE